ncbi:MAG: hypothetical protein OXH50_12320 [Gemmatimonadetes bacterium]|nr:hypothetical protein [Gemmatimonadota bacterium]
MSLDIHPGMRQLAGEALCGLLSNPNVKPSDMDTGVVSALAVMAVDLAEELEGELMMRDSKARRPEPRTQI